MFAELLSRLGDALDRAAIPYMVIGGQAVIVRGDPRLTRDIDVTVGVGTEAIPRLLLLLADLGLAPLPEDPAAFARQTMVIPAADPASGVRVDLILSWTSFEAEAIGRATPVTVDGSTYRVASAADLVVLKIIAGRPRDLDDVRGILVRDPEIDVALIERWLQAFRESIESDTDPVVAFRRILESVRRP